MKKLIRLVDEKNNILQVTTVDERWYIRDYIDNKTGLPFYQYVPSVTWICEHYPKGVAFYKWLASKGWDEAEAIKTAAGDKGSKVHYAVKDLIQGKQVNIDSKYLNHSTDKEEELTLEEYECIMSFQAWFEDVKPTFLAWEFAVWGDGYAGTVDLVCMIDGVKWLVDYKTSQYIWPSHQLQVSAYKKAIGDSEINLAEMKLAILQLGFKMNKKRYKFTEIVDEYETFLAAKLIWAKETKGIEPMQRDYPLSIKLDQGDQNARHKQTK